MVVPREEANPPKGIEVFSFRNSKLQHSRPSSPPRVTKSLLKDRHFWVESVITALLIGLILLGVQIVFDVRSTHRQEEVEAVRAAQDRKAEDVRFVRSLSGPEVEHRPFQEMDLSGVSLRGLNLKWANLQGANLSGADLSGANLKGAWLDRADLTNANFSDAMLEDASIKYADLRGADFTEADLSSSNVAESDLRGANFSRADLASVGFLDQVEVDHRTKIIYANLGYMGSEELAGFVARTGGISDTNNQLKLIGDPNHFIGAAICGEESTLANLSMEQSLAAKRVCNADAYFRGPDPYGHLTWMSSGPDGFRMKPDKIPSASVNWSLLARTLRTYEGDWAIVPGQATETESIQSGTSPWFASGRWETRTRRNDLFIRYLGPSAG